MSHDEIILLDVIRAARLAMEFKRGMDKDEFLQDKKTQSAILHQLMVMGEAVKRLYVSKRFARDVGVSLQGHKASTLL